MPISRPPVYLNLWRIQLPLPGWVSIIQRLSGVILFLLLPIVIYLFYLSLAPTGYAQLLQWRQLAIVKIGLIVMLWLYLQHFLAGIRYLLLDIHLGVSLRWARRLSAATLLSSTALTLIIVRMWW